MAQHLDFGLDTFGDITAGPDGRLLSHAQVIRNVIEEDLDAIWSGKMTAKAGLDDAVARGNELLARFETENGGKE